MGVKWFRRANDISGFEYEAPGRVDRTRLKGHDAVPELQRYESFDGKRVESLSWSYDDGQGSVSTSASPAHGAAFGELDEELDSAALLQRLWEALELPGEPSDYHFAIQGVAGHLWRRRRKEPQLFAWVEWLSWLDIRLVRAWPDAVRDEYANTDPDRREFYSVPAFHTLFQLYIREGFLAEARDVAKLGSSFGQGEADVEAAEQRLATLGAEDGE